MDAVDTPPNATWSLVWLLPASSHGTIALICCARVRTARRTARSLSSCSVPPLSERQSRSSATSFKFGRGRLVPARLRSSGRWLRMNAGLVHFATIRVSAAHAGILYKLPDSAISRPAHRRRTGSLLPPQHNGRFATIFARAFSALRAQQDHELVYWNLTVIIAIQSQAFGVTGAIQTDDRAG